jgi:hypothetical protein
LLQKTLSWIMNVQNGSQDEYRQQFTILYRITSKGNIGLRDAQVL